MTVCKRVKPAAARVSVRRDSRGRWRVVARGRTIRAFDRQEDAIRFARQVKPGQVAEALAIPCRKGPNQRSVPAARLVPVIEQWLDEGYARSELRGADGRRVYSILAGETTSVGFDVADRLLTRMGLPHLWHLPADQGGLEDVYVAGLVVA